MVVRDACDRLGIHHADPFGGDVDINSVTWEATRYSKIQPIDNDVRERFIQWATEKHNIFSLGRFATWRPGLLMDDLVEDIKLIDRWISKSNMYAVTSHAARK